MEQGNVRTRRAARTALSGRNVKMKRNASIHRKKPYVIIWKDEKSDTC